MNYTCEKVILNFIDGLSEGEEGSVSSSKTVTIHGNQLFHYNTPIIERCDGNFILNVSRYSLVTGQLQKKIKSFLPEGYQIVKGVKADYKGSLLDFVSG